MNIHQERKKKHYIKQEDEMQKMQGFFNPDLLHSLQTYL